jgi:hypothetical protein
MLATQLYHFGRLVSYFRLHMAVKLSVQGHYEIVTLHVVGIRPPVSDIPCSDD